MAPTRNTAQPARDVVARSRMHGRTSLPIANECCHRAPTLSRLSRALAALHRRYGQTGADYALQSGGQMAAIRRMVKDLAGV